MYKKTSPILISILSILFIVGVVGAVTMNIDELKELLKGQQDPVEEMLGGDNIGFRTHIGTAANYKSLPISLVEANSTTTDESLPDGGSTINQLYSIQSVDKIAVYINALGGTATSSIIIKPMYSLDAINWYTKQATSSPEAVGTTTPVLASYTISIDPNTASTTKEVSFFPIVANWMRLLIMGENLPTDPDDGVQAFIQVGMEQTY